MAKHKSASKPKPEHTPIPVRIYRSEDYDRFERHPDNRHPDSRSRRALEESIKKYKTIPNYPIVCEEGGDKLLVRDGWTRFRFAKKHEFPVYYTLVSDDPGPKHFSPHKTQAAQKWSPENFATLYTQQGKPEYVKATRFAEAHGLAVGPAFALLAGFPPNRSRPPGFEDGTYKVTHLCSAEHIVEMSERLQKLSKDLYPVRVVEAFAAVHVWEASGGPKAFDPERFFKKAEKYRRTKLKPYATKEMCLVMFHDIYNAGYKLDSRNYVDLVTLTGEALREQAAQRRAEKRSAAAPAKPRKPCKRRRAGG